MSYGDLEYLRCACNSLNHKEHKGHKVIQAWRSVFLVAFVVRSVRLRLDTAL